MSITTETQLLTIPHVARILDLAESTVWRLVWSRELTTVRIGRSVRVRPDDLDRFIQSHLVDAA